MTAKIKRIRELLAQRLELLGLEERYASTDEARFRAIGEARDVERWLSGPDADLEQFDVEDWEL
jgi:hypothetical protein